MQIQIQIQTTLFIPEEQSPYRNMNEEGGLTNHDAAGVSHGHLQLGVLILSLLLFQVRLCIISIQLQSGYHGNSSVKDVFNVWFKRRTEGKFHDETVGPVYMNQSDCLWLLGGGWVSVRRYMKGYIRGI